MRNLARVLTASVLALALTAEASAPQQSFPGADPDIEAAEGRYWIYPTNAGGGRVQALYAWSSPDLKQWEKGAPLLSMPDIGWIAEDGASRHYLWAPDMVQADGAWFLYYSVGPQNPTPSRIGVARCEGPAGPCRDSGRPLVTGGQGFEAIDPAVFHDTRSGKTYLYAGGSAGAKLRAWLLKSDRLTIDREVAVATPPHFTEGAFMHEREGRYYLSYSSGSWDRSNYRVDYATADTPVGPWRYGGTILRSDRRFNGPGHHAFLRDPATGGWHIAYHRWEGQRGDGPYSGSRRVAVQPITHDAQGRIAPITMR